MRQAFVYKNILVIEDYGFYSPAIDRTIVERNPDKIMEWIDNFWEEAHKPHKVDRFILGEYKIREPFLNN